jgi:hypothetical protein
VLETLSGIARGPADAAVALFRRDTTAMVAGTLGRAVSDDTRAPDAIDEALSADHEPAM